MNGEVLNSWKEIAEYMGRGVRTVQRWERELGLPVRRPRGKERSAVLALKSDLDHWLHHTPQGAAGRESSQGIDHLQLRRNTKLLKLHAAEVMAQSQKLQARIAESMALAAALKAKKPAPAKPIRTLSADLPVVSPPGNRPHVNGNAAS
jgi:phage terminase Nu1 subunit (DNA packaging protein)